MDDVRKYAKKPLKRDGREFYPLTLNDQLAIQDEYDLDLSKMILTGFDVGDLSTRLIREIFYRSLRHGDENITVEAAGEINFGVETAKALMFILSGVEPEEAEKLGESGNVDSPLRASTGTLPSADSADTTE